MTQQPKIQKSVSAAQIAQELLLHLSSVCSVLAGLQFAESNGNGFIPASLLVVDENGIVINAVLLSGIAVAGGIAHHNHLGGVIAELQHFLDAGSLGAHILCQNDVGVLQQAELAPLFLDGIPVSSFIVLCS